MKDLQKSEPVTKNELKNVPKRGIYVFFENDKPIYVGRSKNLRQRLGQHSQQYSDHHSATFAFMIAKQDAEKRGINLHKRTREDLQIDPEFSPIFSDAKNRVLNMKIQVIQMDDPVEQTLFEVYAALELNTEYNIWETH